jgi:membrane protease YdiL (CAAX protease family)
LEGDNSMKKFLSTTWSVLKYILIYLGATIIVGIIAGIFLGIKQGLNPNGPKLEELINQNVINITLVASIISLIFFIILIRYEHKNFIKYIGYKKITVKNGLLTLLTIVGLSFFSGSLVNLLIEYFPKYQEVSDTMGNSLNNPIGLASIIILIPAFEEIFFRGIIFKELSARIKFIPSVIISALIFAIFHGNMLQGIYTFIFGIITALVYTWTKSIWTNTLAHIVYNLCGTIVVSPIVYYTSKFSIIYIILGGLVCAFGVYRLYKDNCINEETTTYLEA